MNTRVSIIEDNQELREALALILNSSPGFVCLHSYGDAESALAGIPGDPPDVVLVDIHLPGMSGIECVRKLKASAPSLHLMMLTIESEARQVFQALAAGASGYLVKNIPPSRLLEAIEELQQGGAPMSGQIARMVVGAFQSPRIPRTKPATETEALTPRENEILGLVAKGFQAKEVADELGISPRTVQTHIRNIYEKLHVRSRVEALARFNPAAGVPTPGRDARPRT